MRESFFSTPILKQFDSDKEIIIIPYCTKWSISAAVTQEYDNVLHPIQFVGRVLKKNERNYHFAELEVLALLKALDICYPKVVGRPLTVYTKYSVMDWIYTSPNLNGRAQKWGVMLSPWKLDVIKTDERKFVVSKYLAESIAPPQYWDELKDCISPLVDKKIANKLANAWHKLKRDQSAVVISFDGSASVKTGDGSYGYCIWSLPSWSLIDYDGSYIEKATVNEAEYEGMTQGLKKYIHLKELKNSKVVDKPLIVVGDSRIVIQQSQGIIDCLKSNLKVKLDECLNLLEGLNDVTLIHTKRTHNKSADHITRIVKQDKKTNVKVSNDEKELLTKLNSLDQLICDDDSLIEGKSEIVSPKVLAANTKKDTGDKSNTADQSNIDDRKFLEVIKERRARFKKAQRQEEWIDGLIKFWDKNIDDFSSDKLKRIAKLSEMFTLDDSGILFYLGGDEQTLRLVIPTSLKNDVLHSCHKEVSAGHQGVKRTYHRLRRLYYWRGMFKDVSEYVKGCDDCNTGKGSPEFTGGSPGNILPVGVCDVIAMDFAVSLPTSYRGNTSLLIFLCMFTGYVMCKPMKDTSAQACAEAYEEVVYRRFGASRMVRHDRDPRFMSEVFRRFNQLMGQKQKATLAYRPQANGQEERMVQTLIRQLSFIRANLKIKIGMISPKDLLLL